VVAVGERRLQPRAGLAQGVRPRDAQNPEALLGREIVEEGAQPFGRQKSRSA
jgi:hypothetical protein